MVSSSRADVVKTGDSSEQVSAEGFEWSLKTERLLIEGRYEEWREACRVVAELYPGHSVAAYTTERVTHPLPERGCGCGRIAAAAVLEAGLVATVTWCGALAIWDETNRESPILTTELGARNFVYLCQGPEGGVVASNGDSLAVWNPLKGMNLSYIPLDHPGVTAILCDNKKIFFGTVNNEIYEVGLNGNPRCILRGELDAMVTNLAITEDGELLSFLQHMDGDGTELRLHGCLAEVSGRSRSTPGLAVLGKNRFVTTVPCQEIVLWHGTRRVRTVASRYHAGDSVVPGSAGTFFGLRFSGQITEYSVDGDPLRTISTNMTELIPLRTVDENFLMVAGPSGCEYLELNGAKFLDPQDPAMDFVDPVPKRSSLMSIIAISAETPDVLEWDLRESPKWCCVPDSPTNDNRSVLTCADGRIVLERDVNKDCDTELVMLNAELGLERVLDFENCDSALVAKSGKLVVCLSGSLYVQDLESDEEAQ